MEITSAVFPSGDFPKIDDVRGNKDYIQKLAAQLFSKGELNEDDKKLLTKLQDRIQFLTKDKSFGSQYADLKPLLDKMNSVASKIFHPPASPPHTMPIIGGLSAGVPRSEPIKLETILKRIDQLIANTEKDIEAAKKNPEEIQKFIKDLPPLLANFDSKEIDQLRNKLKQLEPKLEKMAEGEPPIGFKRLKYGSFNADRRPISTTFSRFKIINKACERNVNQIRSWFWKRADRVRSNSQAY